MSDVMAVITVCGEKLVCVDYDRPVWQSKVDKNLRATPNLDYFVVDGILAVSVEELKASGSLIPSGTFTITSPVFAISAITAT